MNILKQKSKFIFAITITFTGFLIISSNTQQAEAANEFIKINSARVNAGYLTIAWEWFGNDALGGGLGVVGIYPSLNNNIEGMIGTPSGIIALHKNIDGNLDAPETTWGRPGNDANQLCRRNITNPEEYTANIQYITQFNKIFDPILNEYRTVSSLSNADKLRITITAGFPCTTTGQFRRADSEDYPIDFSAPSTSSLISAPFWQQTLGNGLDFSVKDLTIRVSNPNVDAYYSGTIYGFAADDYAGGYGITPIEQYHFYNLGPPTPRGFDGYVTLSMQGNLFSSFPLNPNLYYEIFLNAGDTSRPFFIYGSSQDSYPNGKAYYSYSSYPCGPYFNPETTCEYGVNNGIADIFFQFGTAETLLGNESAITTDITPQGSAVIDGDLVAWLDNYRDINVYNISTGYKTAVNDNALKYSFMLAGRKILWTTRTIDNPNDYDRATFIYDLDTSITTEITEKIGMHRFISDFDGQRIVLQSPYESIPGIYLYDLATAQLTLIDRGAFVNYTSQVVSNPKISGNKILYRWFWNCGTWCGQEELRIYDIATGEKTKILNNYGFSSDYAIDGDNIVIVVYGQPSSIFRYKISTSEMTNFAPVSRQITGLDISGNIAVWSDTQDVFIYDIVTGLKGRAGMAPKESLYPKISGNTVVWDDYRNFNADIYMYRLASQNNSPTLSYSQDTGYASDTESPGVDPNKGTVETEFTFKTVYTDADNDVPQNISLVVGDGIATTTRALVTDASASVELRDGNYTNGEQFTATSTFPKKAQYSYHFEVSDGKGGTARVPTTGELQFSVINVPVIIVPGIMGSELFGQNYEGTRLQIWIPNDDDDFINLLRLDSLLMKVSGKESEQPLIVGDVIRKDDAAGDVLYSLIDIMTNTPENNYKEGEDFFVFPYDWRFNIITSATIGASSLKAKIESIKNQTGAQKVDIIAHSQGGLLSKFYIAGHGRGNVRKFIDIATPHLGAPKAFKTLMWGDDIGKTNLSNTALNFFEAKIKKVSQNMPSVYQLLPSEKYITQIGPYFNDVFDMDEDGATGWLDYASTTDFLVKSGRNNNAKEDEWNSLIHNSIDNWNGKEYGVEETVNIVGCGAATIGDIWAFNKKFKGLNEKQGFDVEYMLHYISGDKTVPYASGEQIKAEHTFFVKGIEHANIPSANGVKQLIVDLLKNNTPQLNNSIIIDSINFSEDNKSPLHKKNYCAFSGKTVSFHSPIELHIYDSQNRHTGPTANGFIENNIPGIQYDIIEDNKFAFLPDGEIYTIIGQATDTGTFNARITTYENSKITETRYYNEIPLETLKTNTIFTIDSGQTDYTIQVDQDGNGIFEFQAQPSSVLNTEESQDLTKPETTIYLSGAQGQNNWHISDVEISFSATDDNSGILKTEYSLDNGQTWSIYQQPFIVSTEGATTILYFSTDRAGNYELLKSQEIKIDKTPPETKIFFDQNLKQLKFEGVDNFSSVTVVQNGNNYTLTDEAGHTLVVAFDKLKTEGKEIKAEISALHYDSIFAPAIPKNKLQYEWSLEKDEGIKELNQRIEVEKTFDVRARYDGKKNETTIDTKMREEKKSNQTFQGFTALILTTNSGNFDVKYNQ